MLALVTGGAVAETVAVQMSNSAGPMQTVAAVLGYVGAVALALVPVIRYSLLGPERIRDWTRARSASEALKKEIFTYLTRTSEYADDNRLQVLRKTIDRILGAVTDLEKYVTDAEVKPSNLPEPLGIEQYIERRTNDQIERFYKPRADQLARRGAWFRRTELVLTLAAAGLGAAAAYGALQGLAAWVPVLTTATGAIIAHAEASRYDGLTTNYRATARRLESLRDKWRDERAVKPASPEEQSRFVEACEEAISNQNEAWMAEWIPASAPMQPRNS